MWLRGGLPPSLCRRRGRIARACARFLPIVIIFAALVGCATTSIFTSSPDSRNSQTGGAPVNPPATTTKPVPTTSTTTTVAPRFPQVSTTTSTTVFQPSARPASATGATRPWRLDPLPEAVSLSREGSLPDLEVLVRAALAFSGLEGETLRLRTAQIISISRSEAAKYTGIGDPVAKAEKILGSMHDKYLRTYSAHQSNLDLVFSSGSFNCVSSAVMYLIFARAAGLEVAGIMTADHAFCILSVPGRSIDIETTTRFGFDPGSRKEFRDSFGSTTGFAYVPQKNYAGRATISVRRLVSLILSNRVAEFDRQNHYLFSVGLGVDFYSVEKDAEARTFMFARFRNAAGELSNTGNYSATLEFIDAVHSRYGEEPGLDKVARIAVDNWLGDLGRAGDWSRGVDLILANRASPEKSLRSADFVKTATHNQVLSLSEAGDFDGARRLITSRIASGLIAATERAPYDGIIGKALFNRSQESPDYASGLALLNASEVRSSIKSSDIENARVYLAAREAQRLETTRSSLDAWKFLSGSGLADAVKVRDLVTLYRNNAIVEAHNRFVALFKAKRYAEARVSIAESLAIFPKEPSLAADLELLRSVTGIR